MGVPVDCALVELALRAVDASGRERVRVAGRSSGCRWSGGVRGGAGDVLEGAGDHPGRHRSDRGDAGRARDGRHGRPARSDLHVLPSGRPTERPRASRAAARRKRRPRLAGRRRWTTWHDDDGMTGLRGAWCPRTAPSSRPRWPRRSSTSAMLHVAATLPRERPTWTAKPTRAVALGRGARGAGPLLPPPTRSPRGRAAAPGDARRRRRRHRDGRSGIDATGAAPSTGNAHPRHRRPPRPVAAGHHHADRPSGPAAVGRPTSRTPPLPSDWRCSSATAAAAAGPAVRPPRRRPPHHRMGQRRPHRPDQPAVAVSVPSPPGPQGRHTRSSLDPDTAEVEFRRPDGTLVTARDARPRPTRHRTSRSPTTHSHPERPAPTSSSTTSSRTWPTATTTPNAAGEPDERAA